ncbi:hypothetical protein OIU77_026300 [Salix suchowensis]|uniref:Uncharacterized protein n=1 Tax=Salix suchowensis TaxID=1278906 RepID=A0ABQ9BZ65_9ROSI|nr:hypothetical protein OIU77_026300 [Salix suchowensis]
MGIGVSQKALQSYRRFGIASGFSLKFILRIPRFGKGTLPVVLALLRLGKNLEGGEYFTLMLVLLGTRVTSLVFPSFSGWLLEVDCQRWTSLMWPTQ